MKYFLITLLMTVSTMSFGQIRELRNAQDARKRAINRDKETPYFSKTLYVNPFIGTGGHGHTYPGASAPFGMIQLSPDSRYDGWDGCSGYHYSDSTIYGFSHTHLSGTGVSDYGDLLIVPQIGKPRIDPGYLSDKGYQAKFSHENESASPGYYSVKLEDPEIDVELTTTERCGIHKYTFQEEAGKKFILLDLDHRDKTLAANFKQIDKQTIQGSRISEAWATKQNFFFHVELSQPYQKARQIYSKGRTKLLLVFPKETKEILLKVGISAVDEDGARKNLEMEIKDWNFNKTRAEVTKMWNSELDKVTFKTDDKDVMTVFYTGLYHSYLAPNLYFDVDGRYRGRDDKIHTLDSSYDEHYTVFSLWDTYRGTHPLFTITQQQRTRWFANTFLRQFREGGDLPVWELAGNETECMIGYHSVSVLADAMAKGLIDSDQAELIQAMITTSNLDEFGKQEYAAQGFLGTGDEPESVSKTLEYAYDDFCIAQFLKYAANGTEDLNSEAEALYRNRAYNFLNIYDPKSKFMRGRRGAQWVGNFDPAEVNFNYTEANSWQYSLYAPHAIHTLTEVLGGPDSLEAWLDRLFTTEMELSGRHQVDITGLIGQYAHGNEPSHHMAYLYNYTRHPDKAQYYIDRIQKEMYANAPDGLSGNEDCGQMSSWYVLSALGFYPIAPGLPYYDIGRPLMNQASLELENGNTLIILSLIHI